MSGINCDNIRGLALGPHFQLHMRLLLGAVGLGMTIKRDVTNTLKLSQILIYKQITHNYPSSDMNPTEQWSFDCPNCSAEL